MRPTITPSWRLLAATRSLRRSLRAGSGQNHDRCLPSRRKLAADERGVYATFVAVIASALLLFGGIAYDAPRVTAARQDALHAANEAARVAAATVASGGTLAQAQEAAENRMSKTRLIYGQEILVVSLDCVGSRVQGHRHLRIRLPLCAGLDTGPPTHRSDRCGPGLSGAAQRRAEHAALPGRVPPHLSDASPTTGRRGAGPTDPPNADIFINSSVYTRCFVTGVCYRDRHEANRCFIQGLGFLQRGGHG